MGEYTHTHTHTHTFRTCDELLCPCGASEPIVSLGFLQLIAVDRLTYSPPTRILYVNMGANAF